MLKKYESYTEIEEGIVSDTMFTDSFEICSADKDGTPDHKWIWLKDVEIEVL